MEQKRTLWIIAAVGVFLLVVLGAALILYSPAPKTAPSVAGYNTNKNTSSNGWISLAPSVPVPEKEKDVKQSVLPEEEKEKPLGITETAADDIKKTVPPSSDEKIKVGELTVYADNATIYGAKEAGTNTPQAPQTIINNTTTIDLNAVHEGKPALEAVKPVSEPAKKAVAQAEAKTAKRPAENAARQAVVPVKNAAKKTQAQTPAQSKNTVPAAKKPADKTQYWIQVTSLTSRKNADTAREVLEENKISADVFTYTDAKGQLFYRVRVGPYTTKSEAEYWQSKITRIDSFKASSSFIATTKVEM